VVAAQALRRGVEEAPRKSLNIKDLRLELAASGDSKNHANPLRG